MIGPLRQILVVGKVKTPQVMTVFPGTLTCLKKASRIFGELIPFTPLAEEVHTLRIPARSKWTFLF